MGAFLGISLWVALATVVPGLITIASIYAAIFTINPDLANPYVGDFKILNQWVGAGFAVTIMILTQAFGILLENVLVDRKWLGPDKREIHIAKGIDPHGETHVTLEPYFEYQGLYILLAELSDNEDTQGHLKRALAQFFLTNNSLVSFLSGILIALVIFLIDPNMDAFLRAVAFISILCVFLGVSFKVALIRFEVMAKALWATRRRRLEDKNISANKKIQPTSSVGG